MPDASLLLDAGPGAETPEVERKASGAKAANLNAAGAATPLAAAREAMVACLREEAARPAHWVAASRAPELAAGRGAAARLLGAGSADHVAFGETATRLWASLFGAQGLAPGKRILLGRGEWGGNLLNAVRHAAARGASVETAPADARGRVDVAGLAASLDERVAAICVPAVSSGFGLAQPMAAIGALPRPEGCLLFADAAQAAGRLPVDLREWGADVVVAPARKWLRGPRGQAVAALSDRALAVLGEPPLLDLAGADRPDARRFESFEFSLAGRLGFGEALRHAARTLPATRRAIDRALAFLREGLAARGLPAFEDIGEGIGEDAGEDAGEAAFLTFLVPGESPDATAARLAEAGVAIAAVPAASAPREFAARGLAAVCRVSPHAYSGEEELSRFLEAVASGSNTRGWR